MHSLGISGKELSAQLGVPEATISRWRTGVRLPHKSKIVLLADFFQVPPESMVAIDEIVVRSSDGQTESIWENECRELLDEILYRASNDPERLKLVRNKLHELLHRMDRELDR